MLHCWRHIKSYGHSSTPVEGFSKNFGHATTQVQGDIYTHVFWTIVYTSVYLYTGVLNYETVRHTSILLLNVMFNTKYMCEPYTNVHMKYFGIS